MLPPPREFGWKLRPLESARTGMRELIDGRIEVTIDHALLRGITTEMLMWWFQNMDGECKWEGRTYPRYHLWHPLDHISLTITHRSNDGRADAGSRFRICEAFNRDPQYLVDVWMIVDRLDPTTLRLHTERLGKTAAELEHRFVERPEGVDYRSRLLLGVGGGWLKSLINDVVVPHEFSDEKAHAWMTHNVEEVGTFEDFLPELYRREAAGSRPYEVAAPPSRPPLRLSGPPAPVARAALSAMKAIALADEAVQGIELEMLRSVQRNVLRTSFDLDALPLITPEDLAAAVPPEHAMRTLRAAVVVAVIDGEISPREVDLLERYADALHVSRKDLEQLQKVARDKFLGFRIDVLRRQLDSPSERVVPGYDAIARALLDAVDEPMAERYRALARLEPSTLGGAYLDLIRQSGWALPGEKGGGPEWLAYHDCLRVLGGYDATPTGDAALLAFEAGMTSGDPIYAAFFVLAQKHLGAGSGDGGGDLDPERVFAAFTRGSLAAQNLCAGWDPWEDFERDLDEVRRAYGIPQAG